MLAEVCAGCRLAAVLAGAVDAARRVGEGAECFEPLEVHAVSPRQAAAIATTDFRPVALTPSVCRLRSVSRTAGRRFSGCFALLQLLCCNCSAATALRPLHQPLVVSADPTHLQQSRSAAYLQQSRSAGYLQQTKGSGKVTPRPDRRAPTFKP
jgi:hypothetical protein